VIRFVTGFGLSIVGQLFVVLGLIATFLPLYVIFPDANVGLREAAPGTIVAAVGWFALSRTFSLYTGLATGYAVYGALGAVFLVLVWLYIGSIILVFGAVLNAVLANREVDRQLQSPGHRQIPTEAMTDDATGADEGPRRTGPVTAPARGRVERALGRATARTTPRYCAKRSSGCAIASRPSRTTSRAEPSGKNLSRANSNATFDGEYDAATRPIGAVPRLAVRNRDVDRGVLFPGGRLVDPRDVRRLDLDARAVRADGAVRVRNLCSDSPAGCAMRSAIGVREPPRRPTLERTRPTTTITPSCLTVSWGRSAERTVEPDPCTSPVGGGYRCGRHPRVLPRGRPAQPRRGPARRGASACRSRR